MYQFIQKLSSDELLKHQLPIFALAFVIAEIFYKFHSFTLECLSFLFTWYVLDAIAQRLFWSTTGRRETVQTNQNTSNKK